MPLSTFFRRSRPNDAVLKIYKSIVDQARHSRFYTDFGVPDTVDGRFEMVTLHVFLVLRRLKRESESASEAGQALFDVMFEDMDLSLREMGAGDMGVGKRVKAMVQAFYGRVGSYEAGLGESAYVLEDALARNVFATAEPEQKHLDLLVAYVRAQDVYFATLDRADIEAGEFSFGEFE